MSNYKILSNITHNGERYLKDSVVDAGVFDENTVAQLVEAGVIEGTEGAVSADPLSTDPAASVSENQEVPAPVETIPAPVAEPVQEQSPVTTPEQQAELEQKIAQDLQALEAAPAPSGEPLPLS